MSLIVTQVSIGLVTTAPCVLRHYLAALFAAVPLLQRHWTYHRDKGYRSTSPHNSDLLGFAFKIFSGIFWPIGIY